VSLNGPGEGPALQSHCRMARRKGSPVRLREKEGTMAAVSLELMTHSWREGWSKENVKRSTTHEGSTSNHGKREDKQET